MSNMATAKTNHIRTSVEANSKYLTFSLAGEEYGLGILKVREIIGIMPITSVPQTPPFVKGVINLRGLVIPVIDLRLKFGLEGVQHSERTSIIVVEAQTSDGVALIGLIVDSVSEVLSIKADDIGDTPTFGTKLNTDYIQGLAKLGGSVKILIDIDQALGVIELSGLNTTAPDYVAVA